jgi:hypothetical protein
LSDSENENPIPAPNPDQDAEASEAPQTPACVEASAFASEPAPLPAPASLAVAPVWHTVALVVFVLGLAIRSAVRFSVDHGPANRLQSYAATAGMELVLVAWVLFGLRLRHVSLRSVLGPFSFRPLALIRDAGVALVFWFAALFVLGSLGLAWNGFEHSLRHEPQAVQQSKPSQTDSNQPPAVKPLGQGAIPIEPSQQEALRALKVLAPDGAREMIAWALLCLLVGFCEELVFRGYLQRQCIALAQGNELAGIAMSAAVFGSAHAYQGGRNVVLLAVFGAMFGVLAWMRRSLRAGMMAHSWHDLCAGFAIALARNAHLI